MGSDCCKCANGKKNVITGSSSEGSEYRIRDGVPISSDRYRLSMRGNIVQLALKQSQKNDTGYYSLVATRVGQENGKGALKKIHLSVSETSYEEGEPPVFLRRLSDLAVKVGTRTRFLVEIRSPTTLKIAWYKDDSPIHESPRFSLVHEGNFHCVDVAPVTVEDQGCWTCMAENRSGRSSCTSTLTVIVPKAYKRPEFVEELRALLTEAGTVSLECKVVGVPTPVLRWFKDNKEIKAGDVFALTANPDDPTSLGVYTCEAVNCMGTAYSSSKVHVVGRGSREGSLKPADALTPSGPLPVFRQALQDECCRIGDTLALSCRVQVPPWPKAIAWYNKGGRVEPSDKYHIMEDGIGGYSIEVKQVEAVDEGEWKCVATSEENMKQFSNCYVAMSIPRNYRKPRFMENLKAVLTEEGLVSFECKVVGFPTPLLRWFKDGQELKPGDVYQLTGTNSLGSYCCIARNCMGEAKSTAELTIEDIQNQLNEEERFQLLSTNQPPKFIKGLRSCEARINEDFRFTVQVSVAPEPCLSWYRDDALMDESDKYRMLKETLGTCHLDVQKLEFVDQAEWKCVAANDYGHSVTSCFLKLIIPKHYKKPKFLESLRAILSEEGAVNLECKVIGVPQPVLKWYKDNVELKPGDIHRIISGQDGTCCLGTYTCEAINCMGTVSSSASLLGFEDKKSTKEIQSPNGHELARNLSLSTIHEERTSQLYDTPQTDHSVTLDERGEVSFSFDGKEVSVSLYETPDLTEEEALQIVEMYADQLSEHVTEHNVIELPPMRFVKESSTSGNLLMEAVVIDVSPDYFVSAEDGDDLRTEADVEDVSIMDDVTHVLSSPERDSRSSLKRSARYNTDEEEKAPNRPPRKKSMSISSSKSEKSQRIESESFHSAQKEEPPLSPLSSLKQDDSDTFADALSSAHLSVTENLVQKHVAAENNTADSRKRSLSAERSSGSSLDNGGGDFSFDAVTGAPKKKQRKKKQRKDKSSSEEYLGPNGYKKEEMGREEESELEEKLDIEPKPHERIIPVEETEPDVRNETTQEAMKKLVTEEKPLDDLGSKKETAPAVSDSLNIHVSEMIQKSMEDILQESKIILHKALKTCEKMSDTSATQLFSICERSNDICQMLEASREKGADIEVLMNLEAPLHALLTTINEITITKDEEIVRDIFEPSLVQLSRTIENLEFPSLQPTLTILKKIKERICTLGGTEGLSSVKSISDEFRNISEKIVDPLNDIQSTFSAILDHMEQSKLAINGTTSPQQQVSTISAFATCLAELRECVSHTAHTAMTLKENETLNSLMEFREPLLDLQLVLASEEHAPPELLMIKETTLAIERLQSVVVTILKNSGNLEAISRVGTILKSLEDTDRQISELMERLSEAEVAQEYMLKNLNIDESLSNVHFALSSVLEKQEKHIASCNLITCIEGLRQTIGSSAVTIANLENPVDNAISREISKLNESLLNLQRDLLTEKHEPGEEQILNNLMGPIARLKEIVGSVIESGSSVELMIPMLELLKEIEKDAALVAKEISKKKSQEENVAKSQKESTEGKLEEREEKISKSVLADQINRSLDPIKHWLSTTSEDSTKEEVESILSLTIDDLKRHVSQIAIQTSYSEPPNDESLIEALIDLREPLIRLKNAISVYHGPEDLSALENLGYPMEHLLQTIMDVLRVHAEEESLQPIVDIVKQIENQISLSIKDALHQQELKQSAKALNMETEEEEEEAITVSRETIPGTLTEIPSTPLEIGSAALSTEQVMTEDNFKTIDKTTDYMAPDVTPEIMNNEQQEREENASKLIMILSETLEILQMEMTSILEDFEESTAPITTIPQSKLANSLEELRRTTSTIRVMTTVYGEESTSLEEKIDQATLVLTNLMQPLTSIRELLSKSQEHEISELMILNRLTPLLDTTENSLIKQTIDFVGKDGDAEKELESLLCVIQEIKAEVPIAIQDISSRRKVLECLWDISKPLESILGRMNDLKEAVEETLETDVAKILGQPTAALLRDIKAATQESGMLCQRGPVIRELRDLLEPLLEFHSCLSMVQSSRRSLVPEASLLDERRSVILRAVEGLQKQVCHTIEAIENMEEATLFKESLTLLNSAILQVQKQIGKTDYSRRSSSVKFPLQHRLTGTLSRLASAITALEEHADKDTHGIVSKYLEALQKQISFAQMQFIQIGNESTDEEAIVEGFLYPINQLLSALNILKVNVQKVPMTISHELIVQLQELADSISEFSSSLSTHRVELAQEASETAPIIETFSAVIDVLDHVKDSIVAIEKMIEAEKRESMVITKVESVTDEIIEVSQEEVESVMITEMPPSSAIAQEVVQPEVEDTSVTTQISILENVETITRSEKMEEENLEDIKKREEDRQENERRKDLMIQMSKFNSVISNLTQPLKELIHFMQSAVQVLPASKSEENKRKIQELTALVQILYDIQATNTSIKATLSSLSITVLDSQFSRIGNILADLEHTIDTVISLTDEGVKPELKESIMTSLQSFAEPLDNLENVLASVCETIDKDKLVTENGESLSAIVKNLIPYISDTVKSLHAIQIPECVKMAAEKETEMSKIKEETKDIEETTARPLEELIEAIMDSQEQVEDKASLIKSSSPVMTPTKSEDIDNLKQTETESDKTLAKEADSSVGQVETCVADAAGTLQQALTSSLEYNQMEELFIEEKAVIQSVAEPMEIVEEQSLAMIDQAKIELIQSSKDNITSEEQVKVETLRAIISPLQILHASFDEIGDLEILKSSDETTIAFSSLIEPLLNLELAMPSEDTEELKQDVTTIQKLSALCVVEELQKSFAVIEEQVQLNIAAETLNRTPKMNLMYAIKTPLKDLKMSIECIQSDPETCQLIQQQAIFPTTKQIAVLQTLAKSVEEFGERFIAIIRQLKTEAEPMLSSQVAKQENETLDPKVLHEIIDPIHVLRETLTHIEDLNVHKVELLEMPEKKSEVVQLSAVTHPLEKLEQLLIASTQQTMIVEEEAPKEFSENQVRLANANLKPVLEELKNSIIVVQQQAASSEDVSAKTLNEALEGLKMPLEAIETVIDCFDETTEMEKMSTLLTFAKSVKETANQLTTIGKEEVAQPEIREASLLKAVTISIEGLQSAILKLEDEISQALETKESIKVIALECMVQPLQELQQSFLTAAHQETVLSLQRLPIKPILDNLNKSVAMIQDQVTSVQDKLLVEADTDDMTVLKDFTRSLGNLRTSTVVLQQLNAIENAGEQIVEIENASALQAFAKSIGEFKKCCSVIITRPRVIEAFATSAELKQTKVDTQLLENIITPLRILQEQILIIEETKMQETENLHITDERKPTTVLSSLVGPLQQLEKSFVATVQKEHVIEHDGHSLTPEPLSVSLEKLDLQPILQEVQKSIAIVQEHMVLEAGSQIALETEADALLKSIAQPLVDLRASVASIQQATAVAPESLNELTQQQSVSALETFAENLHNLSECIAMCNHQQIIMEPAADTISEDVSSLNTWADVIEEPLSKVTRPMVVDQGAIDSPTEIAVSISEDEASALKTLAKPLTELRECLALMVEERKTVAPSETTSSLSEKENISSLQTMIQPLLELRDAAAIVIQEQTAIERANDHSFTTDGKNEFALRPLIEPLEELRHSIAIIQDQMLIETPPTHQQKDIILDTLAEPLFDLQRAISVLETRVMSPDIESMVEDMSNSWITECLAIPLHEIERSIVDIRQCTVTEPVIAIVDEHSGTLRPDWSIVEKLVTPMEGIKSTILRIENDSTEIEALKTMIEPLSSIQKNLTLLRNESDLNGVNKEDTINAFVESFSDLETSISLFEKEVVDKPFSEQQVTTNLSSPLTELKRSIEIAKKSPGVHLQDLERPLELVQNALETVLSIQRTKKLSELSTKLQNVISDTNESIESIERKLDQQEEPVVVEVYIEYEALGMLTKPLQNIKQCIAQIQKEPNTDLINNALRNLEKSIAIVREQSADKPLAEPQYTNLSAVTGLSKSLFPCLNELQESINVIKALWHEKTMLEGLTILEEPLCNLQAVMKIICDQFSVGETIWVIDKTKIKPPKKFIKEEIKDSGIQVKKDDSINEKTKTDVQETELAQDKDLSTVDNKAKHTEAEEKLKNKKGKLTEKKEREKKDKKIAEEQKIDKDGKEEKQEKEYKEVEKHEKEKDQIQNENEKQEKSEIVKETEKVEEKQQKRKEIKQVQKKEAENKEDVKDNKIKQDNKDHEKIEKAKSMEKEEKPEEVIQIRKQDEVDVVNNKNEIEEPKKIIDDIKKEEDKQKDKDHEKIEEKEETERKEEQKTEEIGNVKDSRDIKEDKTKSVLKDKKKKKTEEKEEQKTKQTEKAKDVKENNTQSARDEKKKDKIESVKKDEEQQAEELKKKEKEQKGIAGEKEKIEKIEKVEDKKKANELENKKKESNKEKQLTEKIKKEKEKVLKDDEKLEKEQDSIKNKEPAVSIIKDKDFQENEEKIDQLKKEEIKKKEEEQKKTIAVEQEKEEESEKVEIKKLDELEIKKEESNKEKQLSEKIKKEEQKKKDEVKKLEKADEGQKETIQAEGVKIVDDEQVKAKKDIQESKKKSTQKKDKQEDKKAEKTSGQQEKKQEIVQVEEKIQETQNEYVSNIKNEIDEDKSKQQFEETNENQQQEEGARIKQTQEDKIDKKIQKQSREDEDLRSKTKKVQEEQTLDRKLRKQQEEKEYHFEKIEKSRREEKQRQWRPQDDKDRLQERIFTKEKEQDKIDKYRKSIQKEENDRQTRNDNKKFYEIEIESLQKKRVVDSSQIRKGETDYEAEERRRDEKRIRRDETARLQWEEEQRLRRRHDEEIFRNKRRREEQIRENEWSRRRENESDRFLKNMLEPKSKLDKSIAINRLFSDINYPREYTSRFDSGISTLSSSSRSYSSKDSLSSLSRRRLDDYWDHKLRGFSMDKYYYDTGPSYRRRRKRENRMIRARSTSLLRYEDYSTEDSDVTIVPSTYARPTRRTKTETTSRVNFDIYESAPCIYSSQNEGLSWDKPKKPSFCTRLTNRVVETGMRIRLTCTVLGNPEPRVYWTKDGEKLDASTSCCKTRYENGMAYLELYDTVPEDAGIYTCIAENVHGTSSTESTLKVYSDYKPTHMPPTFVRSITDIYRYADRKLILECRVRAHPIPSVSWLRNGQILQGQRYKQSYLDDDVHRLEITDPNIADNGQYTCRATNDLRTEEISHMVYIEDRDWQPASRNDRSLSDETRFEVARRPQFSNLLKDYCVPTGGTIALQVEVKGVPTPEVKWLRGDQREPIAIPKARTFTERGLHTLIVPEATESERGTYVCRAINAYGQVDMSAMVDVVSASAIDGGKPAVFVSRPAKKSIDVTVGEDVSISFRVQGVPKPRVTWMKGLTDITDGPRSYKESIDDYVRLILKRVVPSDEGTYCILVKNRYGCDRSFFSIKVKQRARSLTPSPDWNSVTETVEDRDDDMSYVRNVPGPISSEPVVIDGGKNWLSLSWGKAERRGPAPVIAYKVDAWLLGGDGGARWVELGITPINAFDAFNLRPGGEYKFRVTPRNRYGWGEPVTMTSSALVSENTDLPEFTKILPGQLKALEGTPIELECEVRGDSKTEVRWYRETTEIDPHGDSRFSIRHDGSKCSLTIANVKENDSGRYVCEANNKIGRVSSFARVLVVTDPKIIEADAKLRNVNAESEDRPPQFTMRIRDRRVQTTYPVRLTCQVTGHPVPEIMWYKNDVEISQDDRHIFWDDDSNFHTLEIIHSTLDDSGCYMATARNVNGSVSCRCILVVDKGIRAYIAPEFLRGLDAAYTIPLGGELRMSAQLEAYPSVGVVWHRDGIRLRPSRRAIMTLSHDGTVQFCLANVTARDAGVYTCTATNAVGHAETSTRMAVITDVVQDQFFADGPANVTSASPDIPYSKEPLFVTKPLSTEAVEGDTVVILCEVVGDPKPEVIWLRDFLKPDYYRDAPHFRLVGAGPQYRLEIPYAKLDFTGTYSVIARNCHGEAKAVISLQIYAKGQGKEEQTQKSQGKVLTLPIIKRELRDIRCCDGDAVSLECKVYATPEPPLIRWERGGKIIAMVGDFASEFDGETARLSIQHVYPEDEEEYTCVAYNDLGKAYTSACLVVDVPEGKENILSQRLTRPVGLLSAGSTPRSTPRSTPIRSLSPTVSHGREFRSPQVLSRSSPSRRPKVCPPKFYAVPHNRLVQEGETVRFQCAVIGHPAPWIRWDKNSTIVTPSARISIKERDDVKILEIVDVMREDAALYRVTAENDFGRIEASARLEIISRHEPTSRTIRTRSASPRTYPSFDRSLLPTTSRLNSRLQLECRIRGTPGVTPTWYRNGRPLERSARIKRHFDGTTAKIEITKVKASDAGEYTCVATNVLGSTRSSCQVTVLDPHDSAVTDRSAPRFVQSLREESIVMENHSYELQTGVIGTPPFTVTWSKDGRELPDNDYYKYVVYGDGGVALRLSEVRPQDAGEYVCVVQNDFGVASCSGLFAVQDYKDVSKLVPQFTKTPLSVTVAKGTTACFCARVQCGRTMEIIWTINRKDARENAKCKIAKDGNVSILRISGVSARDTGEIRCTASVNGKGPSISCVAKLRLQRSPYNLTEYATKPEDIQFPAQSKLSPTNTKPTIMPEKVAALSSLKRRRRCEESATRTRSSSFPRPTASCIKHISPLPTRKRISNNTLSDLSIRKPRFGNDPSTRRIVEKDLDGNVELAKDKSSSLHEKDAIDSLPSSAETERLSPRDTGVISNEKYAESGLEEELTKAAIIKEPTDVTVFRGSKAVLRAAYLGCPEPMVKWLRVNRELRPDGKVGIASGNGVSCLTLDDVTYDHAGKYEISVENSLGKERRFFSLAVEGPPEPLTDKPSVSLSTGRATIVWRSPPYDGGRTVIGYTVEAKRTSESTWMVIAERCHSLSHTISTIGNSVVPGESYCFRIRAENIHGLSDPGMESDPVRIPKEGEIMFHDEEEDEFEPSFEARVVNPEEGRLFAERYDVLEELGKGRYGIVKKVIERATGMTLAAKFVRTIKAKDRAQVREEIKIMNALRHPKLLLLAAAYESPRETVLITEYISGGELFERVVADDFTLTERDSILFMRQICQGVEYMHKNNIVHLDLKPENVMCRTRTSHQIKLIDFGLAQTLKSDTPVRVLFGTPEFVPPEIISYEPIGTQSDMWSVGVICYVLLTGLSPFMGDNDAETFANITRADYDLEDEAFDAVSNDAKDFISGLLIKRKELRMSATQCLEHSWMAQHAAATSKVVLPTEKLKKFIIRRKWQKTGNAIRALGRMAILSAYSRRSPTPTAESSPTLEHQMDSIEMQYSENSTNSDYIDENVQHVEKSAESDIAKPECRTNLRSATCVTEINMQIQGTPTEENNLRDSVERIDTEKEEISTLDAELISEKGTPRTSTVHLEILLSRKNKESEELTEKSSKMEQCVTSKSQTPRKVFRGDSRDSGIGDCSSTNQLISSLQVDELGIVSTIEEEVDHEAHNRESEHTKQTTVKNRLSSTTGILVSLTQNKEIPLHETGSTTCDGKVVTKNGVTKTSCETNPMRKATNENTDARILSGRYRDKFLPTGNVSRTARIFERESGTSKSESSQIPAAQRAYPAAIVVGKAHNERIQKAFAFWNK
ncbi:uncharacterized protein LOC105284959 isoform X2 [Ooceraea biroi]|uniref:uncharacterized protein LOC105284959 isoform X2 n=1 Tax=Ooceraea biroi TaxID=2015173 RepID=UPI000F0734A0|nr:uncharacterized protein LOC105284959 isoform X2 [Ooceraea biroi]